MTWESKHYREIRKNRKACSAIIRSIRGETMDQIERRSLAVFLLIALGVTAFWGCAGLGVRMESPRVNLANIQVLEVRAFETVFQIEIRVINPNNVPLEMKGIDCELDVNGKTLASGVSGTETTIPAFGTGTVPIKVYSSVVDMVRSLLGLQEKEKLEYRLKGRLQVEGGLMVPSTIPFESKGEISLKELDPTLRQ